VTQNHESLSWVTVKDQSASSITWKKLIEWEKGNWVIPQLLNSLIEKRKAGEAFFDGTEVDQKELFLMEQKWNLRSILWWNRSRTREGFPWWNRSLRTWQLMPWKEKSRILQGFSFWKPGLECFWCRLMGAVWGCPLVAGLRETVPRVAF